MNLLKKFQVIEAAGGIVKNPRGELLAIFRLGKWDLPKGKMEKGEKPEETARREIAEECGITGHKLIGKICDTYHTYKMGNKKILKKTHWFAFIINKVAELTPQIVENIEEAQWVRTEELLKRFGRLKYNIKKSILPGRSFVREDWHCIFCNYSNFCWKDK